MKLQQLLENNPPTMKDRLNAAVRAAGLTDDNIIDDAIELFRSGTDEEKIDWIDNHKTKMPGKMFSILDMLLGHISAYSIQLSPMVQEYIVNIKPTYIGRLVGKDIYPCLSAQQIAIDKNAHVITSLFSEKNNQTPSRQIILRAIKNKADVVYDLMSVTHTIGKYLTNDDIRGILTDSRTISVNGSSKQTYDDLVKMLFPRSSLLVDRWVGYGDHVRQRKSRGTKQ